jgi:hypothetical protein
MTSYTPADYYPRVPAPRIELPSTAAAVTAAQYAADAQETLQLAENVQFNAVALAILALTSEVRALRYALQER